MTHDASDFQQGQLKVIRLIEQQVASGSMSFSTVESVDDFERDARLTLTGVHFLKPQLCAQIDALIKPLQQIEPEHYYYNHDSLHTTIKNVRVVHDPPLYTKHDIAVATSVFDSVVARHAAFNAYYFTLIQFPNSLSLIGTTDPELDSLILDLDRNLQSAHVPDDKVYTNADHFFSNSTLIRFRHNPGVVFKQQVEVSKMSVSFNPYLIDSVSLVTGNAVMKKLSIINRWQLPTKGDSYGGE